MATPHLSLMTRTLAFIQARMSSNRFPGKVLEPIGNLPMIVFMVRRARRAKMLDEVVVVTSTDLTDDPLVAALAAHNISSFRGNLKDVLNRYAQAAEFFGADEIVRLTGDCPLIDPHVIDSVVRMRRLHQADYASNIDPPSFPDGLDCECFTANTLRRASLEATHTPEREHVTLWMREKRSQLRRANLSAIFDASHLRLTVDYPDDLEAVRRITSQLSTNDTFDYFDILRVLDSDPTVATLNQHTRNESLAEKCEAPDQHKHGVSSS